MLDAIFVLSSLAFFALAAAYTAGCERLSPVASAFKRNEQRES